MDGSQPEKDKGILERIDVLVMEMLVEIAEIKARLLELEKESEYRTLRQPD